MLPEFIKNRVQRELDAAKNPKGMALHTGKVTLQICDVERMLLSAAPTPPGWPTDSSAPFGSPELLQQVRDLCQAIERLPAGEHQSKMSSLAGDLAFGMQNLQMHGAHFWPRPVPTPPEVEPVAQVQYEWHHGHEVHKAALFRNGTELPNKTLLYTSPPSPADGGLRKAAVDLVNYFTNTELPPTCAAWVKVFNLRAALNKGKSC